MVFLFDAVEFAKAIADETRQKIMAECCCNRLTVKRHHAAHRRVPADGLASSGHPARGWAGDRRTRRTRDVLQLNQERITVCCGRLMAQFAPQQAITQTVTQKLECC